MSDLESRIIQLLDGELGLQQIEQLDAELLNDRQARELYIQTAALHSALQNQYLSCSNLPPAPIISVNRLLARHRRQLVKLSLVAAAALLAISAVSLWMIMAPRNTRSMARFLAAPDTTFTLTHSTGGGAPAGNNALHPGSRLRLGTGTMEVKFDSGVRCVIEAPCELVTHTNNRISMTEGVAWFMVPPPAVGFTVETPQFTIIDLGTEFGIISPGDGSGEVHVLTGKVAIEPPHQRQGSKRFVLDAGQARRMDSHGNLVKTALKASRFMKSLPGNIVIRNPNFDLPDEMKKHRNNVGYGPITNWATSGLGIGVSSKHQPFLRQLAHSGKQVAFIQGKGAISQSVSGFDPTKLYSVTYFVSERGLPGAVTHTSVSLDLGTHSYSPPCQIVKTAAFRRIVSGPLAVFGPTANIEIRAQRTAGDASLLVDSVSISRAVPAVTDGGFEDPVQPHRSYKQANGAGTGSLDGTAWTFEFGSGITTNGSHFSPPPAPEGSQAAIIQGGRASLRIPVTGFEPGVTYTLSLDAAGRSIQSAPIRVMLGDLALSFGNSETITPAPDRYTTFTSNGFTPAQETQILNIESLAEGTTFIDDLRFNFVAEADDPTGAARK